MTIDRRGTNSSKWLKYPADVLPMWIADSDFRCAQPIVDEMKRLAEHGVYGYPYVQEGSFGRATVRWCHVRYDWDFEGEHGGLCLHWHSPRGRGEGVLRTG